MNPILDDETYSFEERLEMAKIFLALNETKITDLKAQLDNEKSTRAWIQDQSSNYRMGL